MPTFCVTFGQLHPLKDHWVEIIAPDYKTAHEKAFELFGEKFSTVRELDLVMPEFFPGGRAGVPVECT